MNLQLRYYLFCISQLLPYGYEEKQKVLNFIKDSILDYMAEYPNYSFREVKKHFGTPEQVVVLYGPEGEQEKKKFLAARPTLRILLFTVCWMVVLLGVFSLTVYLLQQFAWTVPVHVAK